MTKPINLPRLPIESSAHIAWAARAAKLAMVFDLDKTNPHALLWSLPEDSNRAIRTKRLKLFVPRAISTASLKQIHKELVACLEQPSRDRHHAWEALFWQSALISFPGFFSSEMQLLLIEHLLALVDEAGSLLPEDDPLHFQWQAVELPWMLGLCCSELPDSTELIRIAQRNFVRLCEACFTDAGLPAAEHLVTLPAIVASWTRCSLVGQTFGEPFIPKHELARSHAVLQQMLRFTHTDGTGVFSTSKQSLNVWIELAVKSTRNEQAAVLAECLLEKQISKSRVANTMRPSASVFSTESKLACLRTDLSKTAPMLAVTFDDSDMRLELFHKVKMFSGLWTSQLTVNGRLTEQTHEWEDVLWYEDEDTLYLELETRFDDVWRVQRQIVLPKEDPFLFLADAVIGTEPAKLKYEQGLPLPEGMGFTSELQSREGWLTQGSNRWLTLPLACPEWRSERSHYELNGEANRLLYTAEREGCSLYSPLFLMLNPARGKLEYTWRQLTVGEQLEIQSPDVAVASRVHIGDLQWVCYRALSHKGNRTFLGKNLATEFYLGRFQRDGSFATIMEVE